MSVHAVGVLLEKIYLLSIKCERIAGKYTFLYISIADNNQKMKGRTEEGKKSKQTVDCNFKSLNLPM